MNENWRIDFTPQSVADLSGVADFLIETALATGQSAEDAVVLAEKRIEHIRNAANRLSIAPFQGTRDDAILPDLRHVTKDRAIIYFTSDEDAQLVRVLAVFYGGQEHRTVMLKRMLEED